MFIFKKLAVVAALLCAATGAVAEAQARTRRAYIKVQRDMTDDPTKQDIQDFGCIVVRRADGNGGLPYAAVSGGATGNECAKFEITFEGEDFNFDDLQYRFLELSTNKMMSHPSGSHWIYFGKDAGDHSADSLFYGENYVFWNTQIPHLMLRPSNDNNRIYAQYDSGDLNVKGSGFKVFPRFEFIN